MSDVSSRALDRRQLIKAGAWAAPVIVLATAAPAAAAQSVDTRTYSGAALVGVPLSIDNEATAGLGKVCTHMEYRRNAFPYSDTINGSQIDVSAPAQLSVGWQIVAIGPGASTHETIVASGTAVAMMDAPTPEIGASFTLTPGSYRFELRFTAVNFTANPVKQSNGVMATFKNTTSNPVSATTFTIT